MLKLLREVGLGIYYLHCSEPPVLHLDLKSANVLLDEFGVAKVSAPLTETLPETLPEAACASKQEALCPGWDS